MSKHDRRKRGSKFYFKNEAETMKLLGLEPTKGSGSGWLDKEDGENDFLLCQHKSTDAMSYKLDILDIEKLEYHANVAHKIPIFAIEYLYNNNIYIILKPHDIQTVAEYLNTGIKPHTDLNIQSTVEDNNYKPKRKMVKSGGRDTYEAEQEKLRLERIEVHKKNKQTNKINQRSK